MIIYWLIFLLYVLFAYRDYRKAILLWFPFQLLFNECVCLKYTSPAVTLVLAVDVVLIFFSIWKGGMNNRNKFLFSGIMLAYVFSFFLSNILSGNFISVLTNTIKYFITNFLYLIALQYAIKSIKDIKIIILGIILVGFAISLLAIYEVIAHDNPILDYVYYNTPSGLIDGKMYYVPPSASYTGDIQIRYGGVRAYSFFHIHIFFGVTCVILLYVLMYFWYNASSVISKYKIPYLISIGLLILGTFLSNSKTPLLGLFIVTLSFFKLKQIFNYKVILSLACCIIIVYTYFPNYLINLTALIDDKVAQEGGGSSVALRMMQFNSAFELFLKSPLWGYGIAGPEVSSYVKSQILGLESSWLQVPIQRGLIGLLLYIYLYIFIYNKLKIYMNKKQLYGLIGSFLAMETATGVLPFSLFGGVIIVIYKYMQFNKIIQRYKLIKKQASID